jgi:hypothetical protein
MVDKIDVFFVGHVHVIFLSMIMYSVILAGLQAQRSISFQAFRVRGAGAANPLFLFALIALFQNTTNHVKLFFWLYVFTKSIV